MFKCCVRACVCNPNASTVPIRCSELGERNTDRWGPGGRDHDRKRGREQRAPVVETCGPGKDGDKVEEISTKPCSLPFLEFRYCAIKTRRKLNE